jgi:hypothetical protein
MNAELAGDIEHANATPRDSLLRLHEFLAS